MWGSDRPTVIDDDTIPPTITLGGSQGIELIGAHSHFTWSTVDASGSSSTVAVTKHGQFLPTFPRQYPSNILSDSFTFDAFGPGTYTISIVATDMDADRPSDQLASHASAHSCSACTPISRPGGPYSAAEGAPVFLDGGSSSDADSPIVKYEWDLAYDGGSFQSNVIGIRPVIAFNENFATRTIALRVTDSDGLSHIASTGLTVYNVAPTATINGPTTAPEGTQIELTSTVSDPSPQDTWTYSWWVTRPTRAHDHRQPNGQYSAQHLRQ